MHFEGLVRVGQRPVAMRVVHLGHGRHPSPMQQEKVPPTPNSLEHVVRHVCSVGVAQHEAPPATLHPGIEDPLKESLGL
eukprot:3139603-Alexandrium_andersonii.AAC.1